LQFRHVRPAGPTGYDGIPYWRLPIDSVDWRLRAEHIRRRSHRSGRLGELDVEPEWATEAAMDRSRLVGDSGSASGLSIQVVGHSPSAGRVVTVILVPRHRPPAGEWWGATAWTAGERQRRAYRDALDRSGHR
jgi:hypothetical protein